MRRYLSSGLLTRDDRFPMVLPEASNKDSEMEKKMISPIAWLIWESVAPPQSGMTVAISFTEDIAIQ